MSRWLSPLSLLVITGCDSTFSPPPPYEVAAQARAISLANTHTGVVTELAPNTVENVSVTGIPQPTDAEGNPLALMLPAGRDVAVGRVHACMLSTTGSVHCWGDHTLGALGSHRACIPPPADQPEAEPDCVLGPLILPALPPARELAAGDDVTCAILEDADRVVCWGERGDKLGGSVLPSLDPPTPVKLPDGSLLAADRLTIAHGSVCAITHDRTLWCWGERFGATPQLQPQIGVIDIAIGRRHSCIIDDRGLACWGDNRNGQVGNIVAARKCRGDSPCVIANPHPIDLDATRVVVGERHTCALRRDGLVACWGSNEVGQLGRDDAFLVGELGYAIDGAVDLTSGYAHVCALRDDGGAWCWGSSSEIDPSVSKENQ